METRTSTEIMEDLRALSTRLREGEDFTTRNKMQSVLDEWTNLLEGIAKDIDKESVEGIKKKLATMADRKSWRCAYLDNEETIYAHTQYTGHMHYGSPFETCYECGNCDGARCQRCRIEWIIEDKNLPTDGDAVGDGAIIGRFYTDRFDEINRIAEFVARYLTGRSTMETK